jgi:hypothetical protein
MENRNGLRLRVRPMAVNRAVGEAADLPPCGGDARQGRGGCCPSDLSTNYSHTLRLISGWDG